MGKPIEIESRWVVARDQGWGELPGMESNCLMGREFPFGVMKRFWN